MEKRLIVLTDLSEQSVNLLQYASEWSKHIGASLLLVHETAVVAPAFADDEQRKQIIQDAHDEALEQLKNLAGRVDPPAVAGGLISFKVSDQSLQVTLDKALEEPYEHLVFLGLKKIGLWEKVFLGSRAVQIIENSSDIVVALPKEMPVRLFKKVYVAVSEQRPLDILQLNNLLKFVPQEQTELIFFYISKPYEKTKSMKKQLESLADLYTADFETGYIIYEGGNPFQDIKKVINDKTDEILVIQRGSRLLTDHIFRKFLVNELVYEGQTPLIVLP